jgi:hypothetical protein
MVASLAGKYREKGVLIDSNLLIGFVIGMLGKQHLHNCRATKNFTAEDFDLLNQFLARFRKHVTTPHILTEVSNLGGRLPEGLHAEFRSVFRKLIHGFSEETPAARSIADHDVFLRVGLTDAAITLVSPGEFLVLTDELRLLGYLQKRGVDAVNFNHLRTLAWL